MDTAICFKCGYEKSGALIACRNCKAAPKTNSECAISLALSDHLSTKERLTQYSHELRSAKKLSVPREALVQAFDALKDPQILAMRGAQSSASEAAPQPSPIPRAVSQQLQAQSASSSAPNDSVTMKWSEDIEVRKELADAVRISYLRIWDSCVTGYVKSEWRNFDVDVLAKVTRRFVYEFSADGVDELVSGEAATEILEQQIEVFRRLYTKTAFSEASAEVRMIVAFLEMVALRPEIQQPDSMPRFVQNKQLSAQPPVASIPPSSKPAPRFAAAALNKSPFAVLGVTTRDDRRRIVDLAEEKSLELDHELCQKARSDLTNPRTRLSAEIAWLPGVSPRKASQLVDGLLQNPMAVRQESGLPTLARLNLMASAFETVKDSHDSDDLAEFIQEFANLAEDLYPEEVLRVINEDRSVSSFPEVKAVEQVEDELSERKRYYRNAIREALDRLPSAKLVQVMTDAVNGATLGGEDHAPGLIDDLVDSYEVETQAPLQSGAENIHKLIQSAKDAAPSGETAVKPYVDKIVAAARSWDRIAQPIQLSAKARGIEHDLSSNLGWAIRNLALDLFNNHDILSQTQRLTGLLQELFSEIPEISERVEQDADALEGIASDRNKLTEKFKDFSLSGNFFTWKNRAYDISTISHIGFYRSVTTHKTNFVETGKTEKATLTLTLSNGQTVNISIDEQGVLWNKNRAKQIQTLADFYGYLMHVTFDRRLKFYEDQIERDGYWLYDECYFYPLNFGPEPAKIVFRGRNFNVGEDSFLRSYGNIELRKKGYGLLDKLKREVSLTKFPQFSTLTDTDVIFHMLGEHMGLRWNN